MATAPRCTCRLAASLPFTAICDQLHLFQKSSKGPDSPLPWPFTACPSRLLAKRGRPPAELLHYTKPDTVNRQEQQPPCWLPTSLQRLRPWLLDLHYSCPLSGVVVWARTHAHPKVSAPSPDDLHIHRRSAPPPVVRTLVSIFFFRASGQN